MDLVLNWLQINWVETTAALLGLIGIFLQIKQNSWYWLTAIIMVIMYVYVFFKAKFYADMSFQFYYLAISVYGWYYWITGKAKKDSNKLTVTKLSKSQWIYGLVLSGIFFILIYIILSKFTDSDVAVGDAFTTALSFVASWFLARKIIENWIWWIVVDFVSAGLYIYKGLYPSAILFTVLTILAFVGYFQWKKALINE
jgi:nicotinamide mononucleotide transporter